MEKIDWVKEIEREYEERRKKWNDEKEQEYKKIIEEMFIEGSDETDEAI